MTPFWGALVASAVLTGMAIPLLRRAALLDRPNHRSSHVTPVPRGGGAAVMVAVVAGTALGGRSDVWPVVVAALLLATVGLADDLRSLSPVLRLTAQLVVGAGLCGWFVVTGDPDGSTGAVALVIGAVGFAAFDNAFNFMDGINGISAMNAAVSGAWFAWLGHRHDLPGLTLIGLVVAGSALGFLPWNAASRVFLGDVGSYGIGALVAGSAILAWVGGVPVPLAVASLLVYLADTSWVIISRARAGKALFEAHREHAYQRLVQAGWPQLATAVWTAGVSCAVVSVVGWLWPESKGLAVVLTSVLLLAYLAAPRVVESRSRESVPAV